MHCLLFLEFIGTTELLVVLVVALVIFGPRKLPELGRSLGRALSQLQAASNDFKHTWEVETRREAAAEAPLPPSPDASASEEPPPAGTASSAQDVCAEAGGDVAAESVIVMPRPEASLAGAQG